MMLRGWSQSEGESTDLVFSDLQRALHVFSPRTWAGKLSRDFLLRWIVCCQETRTKQMVNVRIA